MRRTKVTHATMAILAAAGLALTACTVDDTSTDDTAMSTQSTAAEAETATETETPTSASSSTDSADSSDDLKRYDGYVTNSFFTALHQLPGLEVESGESDPKEHRVEAELFNSNKTLRVLSFIYIPSFNDEYEAVTSPSDRGFKRAYDSAVEVFTDEGDTYDETNYDTNNLKWRCVEGTNTQGGDIDYAVCLTHFGGRIIEAHRLILSEDRNDSDKALDKLLQDFDDALSNMKKRD
ncbi:hypothetical protein QP994_09900 [Corynebacterium sp. MSK044]|uniref:hypothetical protein n=1 Tax=Corynebacterium sp. MSK044 TaxID=3050195 RepID=UPI00254C2AB9|nr:hypothetical protein [Corynebacterium sp. MSK044]MDK8798186.1 hypothetical protein [Corynebacterium sp. MSK044]